ncbi:Uncharacterised protein [Serratia liquefaciens]|nr:Uncharacterised protein [Serratia liquefaciens]
MGNAVPGLVLGILIGKGVEESGWNRVTKVMMVAIVALFVLSGFFRGFDMKMIESFPSDRAELAGHDPQLTQRQVTGAG